MALLALLLAMSIQFADNFDSGSGSLDAGWTVSAGFVSLQPGGCNPSGRFVGCSNGGAYHALSGVSAGQVSVRTRVAVHHPVSTSLINEMFWVHFPGIDAGCSFIYSIGTRSDG